MFEAEMTPFYLWIPLAILFAIPYMYKNIVRLYNELYDEIYFKKHGKYRSQKIK